MNKWQALAQAFSNIGRDLENECLYHVEADPALDQLYINYVQLLETIKVQRVIIHCRFDGIIDALRKGEVWVQ